MELISVNEVRSASCGEKTEQLGVESLQFGEEIERLMAAPPETASSFTALLELPANQAMELLHSPEPAEPPAPAIYGEAWSCHPRIDPLGPFLNCPPTFSSNSALLERASRFSLFTAAAVTTKYPETSSIPPDSNPSSLGVKQEPADSDSNPNSSDPNLPNNNNKKSKKRKEREKKPKGSTKKSKSVGNEFSGGDEKLPYVHVRARRGQATDSHSLAERARREKINARMKLLQELVPGCNQISGTAMVLDEIINHVQCLQRQVEFLSMKLAAVNPRIDFNLDSLLVAESGSRVDNNLPSMVMPLMWPEGQVTENRQQYQQLCQFDGLDQPVWGREDNRNFITPENSLMTHSSSTNSACLHSNQLKMEL